MVRDVRYYSTSLKKHKKTKNALKSVNVSHTAHSNLKPKDEAWNMSKTKQHKNKRNQSKVSKFFWVKGIKYTQLIFWPSTYVTCYIFWEVH